MTSLYMVGGGVILFVAVIWILVSVSKKAGSATAKVNTLKEGEHRRESFDNANQRSLATGRGLIRNLRAFGDRRNRM